MLGWSKNGPAVFAHCHLTSVVWHQRLSIINISHRGGADFAKKPLPSTMRQPYIRTCYTTRRSESNKDKCCSCLWNPRKETFTSSTQQNGLTFGGDLGEGRFNNELKTRVYTPYLYTYPPRHYIVKSIEFIHLWPWKWLEHLNLIIWMGEWIHLAI